MRRFCWVLLMLLGWSTAAAPTAWAQSSVQQEQQQTKERLAALKRQIQTERQQLEQAAEAEAATREKLERIQREISLREELVATYQQRLNQLEEEQAALRDTLRTLSSGLTELKEEYQRRATHAYKYGRLHDLALIFSASTINQMLVRARYLHQFAEQRKQRRSAILTAQSAIEKRREKLSASLARTQRLLADARAERNRLRSLRADRQAVIAELREKRSTLKADIEKKQQAAQALQERIQALIADARAGTRSASRTAAEAARFANLSSSFQRNRGDLPWPATGAITESYGNHRDPVYGTTTFHPGIFIATRPRADVHAVFDGTVSDVDFVPGYGTYLVVQHGEYLSVYSNFSTLYVAVGNQVAAGEVLGQAGTSTEPRGAGLFFAVFDTDGGTSTNPVAWLRDR